MVDLSLVSDLAQRLASSATGYAVVKDGVLDVRTVTDTPGDSARVGFSLNGYVIHTNCTDPDCDCSVRIMPEVMPSAKVVRVKVEVCDD